MSIFLNVLILLALFALLGIAADLAVNNIRFIAQSLKLKLFALGIILGLFTTLPELAVGINANIEGAGALSVGNIMGGIVVLIGLILGTSLILNKKIDTSESLKTIFPASLVILSPFVLGANGNLTALDGFIMVALYAALIFYIYHQNRDKNLDGSLAIIDKGKVGKAIVLALFGVIAVMMLSHFIVQITLALLANSNLSKLFIGVIIFAIGTNLPEISISLSAWRKKSGDLSLSHLLSSAFTNIFVLGSLAILSPISFKTDLVYYVLVFFVTLMIVLLFIFARTDKKLSRKEGLAMLIVYIIFVIINVLLV